MFHVRPRLRGTLHHATTSKPFITPPLFRRSKQKYARSNDALRYQGFEQSLSTAAERSGTGKGPLSTKQRTSQNSPEERSYQRILEEVGRGKDSGNLALVNLEVETYRDFYERYMPSGPRYLTKHGAGFVSRRLSEKADEDVLLETDYEVAETFALAAALCDVHEGVTALLLHWIRRGQPDRAIGLYHKYVSDQRGPDWLPQDQKPDEPEPLRYTTGRADALLAAIAACASKNDFYDALQRTLDTSIRVTPLMVRAFLKRLSFDEALYIRTQKWISILDDARLLARPSSFFKHVSFLAQDRNSRALSALCGSIIAAMRDPDGWLAMNEEEVTFKRLVALKEEYISELLSALLHCRRLEEAMQFWKDLESSGVQPGSVMWNGLLKGYLENGYHEEAVHLWKVLQPYANRQGYIIAINGFSRARNTTDAMRAFREFTNTREHEAKTDPEIDELRVVYNTALSAMLSDFTFRNLVPDHLRQMRSRGPAPDIVTYNTLLRTHAAKAKPDTQAMALELRAIANEGLSPDVVTLTTVLTGLLRAKNQAERAEDAVQTLNNLMQEMNLAPNTATYGAVIDTLAKDPSTLNAALALLSRTEDISGAQPTLVTYTSVMSAVLRDPTISPHKRSAILDVIQAAMQRRRMRPNAPMYHVLMTSCFSSGTQEGVQAALKLFTQMRSQGIVVARRGWHIVLYGLIRAQQWETADEMVITLEKSDFVPDEHIRTLIDAIRVRKPPRSYRDSVTNA